MNFTPCHPPDVLELLGRPDHTAETETTSFTATTKGGAREARAPFIVSVPVVVFVVAVSVSVVCDQVDQVVPAHQADDIDEVHELDPVHQVDHKDEYTSHHISSHRIS